ncbi:MAG: hypothetical protein HC902_14095 [Calothrix sp. SM1_5_4]|nr:hypothetical protein [Calothrix sp. SM1_5_4]
MKVWIHRYELVPKEEFKGLSPRAGALLKVEWASQQIGYSDLHPWPEFGEPPLDEHLSSLASVQFTKLAARSMEFNYTDREFRLRKKSAFAGVILPRSHKLVCDLSSSSSLSAQLLNDWQAQGYSHLKVKMGGDLKAETEALVQFAYSTTLLWRIDFNGKLSAAEFAGWWNGLDPRDQGPRRLRRRSHRGSGVGNFRALGRRLVQAEGRQGSRAQAGPRRS